MKQCIYNNDKKTNKILCLSPLFVDDHSRIILTPSTSDGRGGFINANYIEASIHWRISII